MHESGERGTGRAELDTQWMKGGLSWDFPGKGGMIKSVLESILVLGVTFKESFVVLFQSWSFFFLSWMAF